MSRSPGIISIVFLALSILFAATLFVVFFNLLPIENTSLAIDWKQLWYSIHDGQLRYHHTDVFTGPPPDPLLIPPWDGLVILPLGFFPMRASWGLIVFFTTAALVASVPRTRKKWLYWVSNVLLVLSFPSLRHAADGNLEALIIGGVTLIAYAVRTKQPYALAAGILLAVTKPQEVVLLMVALGLYMLLVLPRPIFWKTLVGLAVVVIPTMLWLGRDWLGSMLTSWEQGSIMDASLAAAMNRTGFLPGAIQVVIWGGFLLANLVIIWMTRTEFSREKAGMLIAASLLVSPYAAGNNVLTVLAIGIIPFFQKNLRLGLLLIVLIDLSFLANANWQAYYTTAVLLVYWGVLLWWVLKEHQRVKIPEMIVSSGTSNAVSG